MCGFVHIDIHIDIRIFMYIYNVLIHGSVLVRVENTLQKPS